MGTVFSRRGAVSSFQPKRSSSQPRTLATSCISGAPFSADDYFGAADVGFKFFQRARRRTGDIPAAEVVKAIVAGAPHLARVAAVLHGTTQVGAHGRESTILTVSGEQQQPGARAESKNL